MRLKFAWVVMMVCYIVLPHHVQASGQFDKGNFYAVMASGDIRKIDEEISVLESLQPEGKSGYEGALLMRKAGIVEKPKDRSRYFKEGRMKFDTAMRVDKDNVEYHFLRLTIQEHVPNAVKYKGDLQKDKEYVIGHFNDLPHVVQKAVMEYSRSSRVLHKEDLDLRHNE